MRQVRNCNVCVVGGAGFLGSHLVDHLIQDRGCHVTVVDNLVAGQKEFVNPKARFEYHDITGSEDYLRKMFQAYKIKYVFNYAARPYIPLSFERPLYVCDVNFMGAMKVTHAAQEAGCEGILQVSSAEIYGGGQFGCAEEDSPSEFKEKIDEAGVVVPHSSYGASKAAVDFAVQAAWRERKTPCIALRQFNCVGERETHPYVVTTIISQLYNLYGGECDPSAFPRKPARVHLGNNSFRDFLYAGDAVRIAVGLLEQGEFGEVYNLGSETGIKMYDLAKLIGKLMGFESVEVVPDASRMRPWEIWHLQSDNTKIKSVLKDYNWEAGLTPLETALKATISYYRHEAGGRWCWEPKVGA